MGFFKKTLTRVINVHPQHLGPHARQQVRRQCKEETAADGITDFGFVIHVLAIPDQSIVSGKIDHLTGRTQYTVTFDAICFKPFKNEVMDTVVVTCTSQGFFAEVGPFQLFVSKIHIPADFEFRAEDATWHSAEAGISIAPSSAVRLRIMGVNSVKRSIAGIGTINEAFLGPIA